MKRTLLNCSKYIHTFIFAFAFFLATGLSVWGQTPGLIIKPITGGGKTILDPDGDGYVSKTTGGIQLGFTIPPNNDVTQSEIPYVALVKPDKRGDLLKGPTGGFTDIVGIDAEGNNAILTYSDGTNLYYRFRLSGYAPNSKSYSILIDTDGKMGFTGLNADPDAVAGNPGFEVEIVLETNFNVKAYNVAGTTTGVELTSYGYDTNCQKSIAVSTDGGDPDYFYDFYIPYLGLTFTNTTPLRYVALASMNPKPVIGSNSVSDIGGADANSNLDQVFVDLVNAQTPTLPGAEVLDRSACPTITAPVSSGVTSVAGTSSEAVGTTIRLYVNDILKGSATTVTGGAWSISGLLPLNGGDALKATAEAPGKGESSSTCNLSFVGSSCSILPVAVSLDNGDKGGRVTNVALYPVGTVFTLYNASTNTEWVSSSGDNNPYTITSTDITNGTIDIGCGGTGNCLSDGSYYIVAKAPGKCMSQKAFICVGKTISASTTPVVNGIVALSSYITGTGGIGGAIMYIYANGTLIGSQTLLSSGNWSVPVKSSLICNTTITASQIAPSQCISGNSTAVIVGSAVTSAPVISVDKCTTPLTIVKGFSGESTGTVIEVFVNGTSRGTTTVSVGEWSLTTTSITSGQIITARATNSGSCKTVSVLSAPVTLSGTTSLTGKFSIVSTIAEGAGSVPITVDEISGTYILNLYIDGDKIGSQSFTGIGIVTVPVTYVSDIYTGGKLQVSLTQGTQCESTLSTVLATVSCNTPSFTNSVIGAPLNNKCVATSGTITVPNSQTMVIYTPVDQAGVVKGYSTLGTGGTIYLTTNAFLASGPSTFYVRAQRIVGIGSCEARSSASVSFNAYAAPQFLTHPSSKIVCSGESTSLTTSWSGIGPFNIQWQYNNGSGFVNLADGGIYTQTTATNVVVTQASLNISSVTGLDNTTYRCIVTDTSVPTECQSSTSDTSILSVSLVTISGALITNSTAGNNGAINITTSGGTGPYLYDWHHLNGAGTFGDLEDLTGLAGGNYTVTVKDANNCTYQQTFTVGGIGSINITLNSQTNITCYGANNGQFTVGALSGTIPYSYSINNFATSQTSGSFANLTPGIHTVKARDANLAESGIVLLTITEPVEMVINATISNPSVALSDGSIYVSLTGGISTFNYVLYKGGISNQSLSNQGNTASFVNLTSGTYSVTVTDANGCIANKSNIILINPVKTTDLCTHTAAHSFNEIPENYSGYNGSYNYFSPYSWTKQNDTDNRIMINNQALAFGLIPAYTSTGNNAVSLSGNPSISRTIDLTGTDPSSTTVSYNYSISFPSGNDDYGIRLYVNGAADAAATYHQNSSTGISDSETLTSLSPNVTFINGINTFRFELYQAGKKYEAQSNFRVDDFTITFKKTITVGITTSPSTCGNGTIGLSVAGGYSPYSYTSDLPVDATGSFVSTKSLQNLPAGTYHLTITDALNCTATQKTITINSAPLTAAVTGAVDPKCIGGGSNGTVTATISAFGNGGPYTYELMRTSQIISTFISASTTKTFTGLIAGIYSVKVTQAADGCFTQTSPVTLTLPVFSSNITFTGGSNSICNGSSTTVAVNMTGGVAPFTVLLSNGQSITNYTSGSSITVSPAISTTFKVISVTDGLSCNSSSYTGSVPITVVPVFQVGVSIAANPSGTICEGTTVTFTATPSNAGANPTYLWKIGTLTVGSNSPTYVSSSLTNGQIVTCIVTKDIALICNTGSPATSNALTMGVSSKPTAVSGPNLSTCSGSGAVNISAEASATNYTGVVWSSNGSGSFANAILLTMATYTPSAADITAGSVILTLTATGSAPCGNASSTKLLTINLDGSWTGALDADWNDPGNWACNQLPTLATNVIIANGKPNYPTLSSGVADKTNNLTIESGASLTVTGNILQIAGAISNSGTFTATEGTIEMKGSSAQTIGSNVFAGNTILNLILDNLAGATLQGPLNVTGIVKASNGDFNSNGNLTLVSTAAQTALIDGLGSGNVLGNVNMQRYLPSLFGYKYFSSPFQAATVGEFSPEVDLLATFPTFYKYDENNSIDSSGVALYRSGWVNYIIPGNPLVPLTGYAANFGPASLASTITLQMNGVVNNGNLQLGLSNNDRKYTKGFNLVGNPYPSPIDWNAAGWIKTSIDNALCFFNASGIQYSGVYSSYVGGVSSGNANQVIAAMQGFFVHVTDGAYPVNGTLGVTNSVRINNLNPIFKRAVIDNRTILRFTANLETKNAIEDAAVIYFDQTASLRFDRDLDALKMTNTDLLVPNLYTLTPESTQLSINGMPLPVDSISRIPLGITTFTEGWINLKAMDISQLPGYLNIYLVDAETGKHRDLKQLPDYSVHLKPGEYNRRFTLVFSLSELNDYKALAGKLFTLSRSGDYLKVTANLPFNTKGNLSVTNILGQTIIRREVFENETVEINQNVSTGVFVITLISGKLKHSEKIIMRKNYE